MRAWWCVIALAGCGTDPPPQYDVVPIDGVVAVDILVQAGGLADAVRAADAATASQLTVALASESGSLTGDARALVLVPETSRCTVVSCTFSGQGFEGRADVDGALVSVSLRVTPSPTTVMQLVARFFLSETLSGTAEWDDAGTGEYERITYEAVVVNTDGCAVSGDVSITTRYPDSGTMGSLDFAEAPVCADASRARRP